MNLLNYKRIKGIYEATCNTHHFHSSKHLFRTDRGTVVTRWKIEETNRVAGVRQCGHWGIKTLKAAKAKADALCEQYGEFKNLPESQSTLDMWNDPWDTLR